MPKRVTGEVFQSRLADYCCLYGVRPGENGLPPYPAGQRETPQHRAWMALHRAQKTLADRETGANEVP